MHLCVLGWFIVGQLFFFVNAWYTSNYLSPTIYVFFGGKWLHLYLYDLILFKFS